MSALPPDATGSSEPGRATVRLPTWNDVDAAARRLQGHAVRTPLLDFPALGRELGGRILVKAEMLQRTGSFKFRGAFNRISQLSREQRQAGVVAYSSGNHAQGVAAAAHGLGIPARIVMPRDAPRAKIDGTRAWGAEILFYDRNRESREAIAADLSASLGATLIKPFDDPQVIAGQGTVGLEIARQAEEMGAVLDAVLVPCGGGGLISGTALALARQSPATAVVAVEPEGFDDTARSLTAGARVCNDGHATSICDSLLVETPGEITFALNARLLAGALSVSDASVKAAMALLFRELKLVVEPGGAVAVAALLSGVFPSRGKTVAVVCSGGNVDADVFCGALGPD